MDSSSNDYRPKDHLQKADENNFTKSYYTKHYFKVDFSVFLSHSSFMLFSGHEKQGTITF